MTTRYGSMNTTTTAGETLKDIGRLFEKWDKASGSEFAWQARRPNASRSKYGAAKLTVFRDGQEVGPFECSRFDTYAANLRAVYGLLDALRLAEARGQLRELVAAGASLLALPAPAPHTERAENAQPQAQDDPYTVLGLLPGATIAEVSAMWKAKVKAAHALGDEMAMIRLNVARDAIVQMQTTARKA